MEILNSNNEINLDFFRSYGIDIQKDAIILKNDKYFIISLTLSTIISLALGFIVSFIYLKYNNRKDKKLKEITKYIEEINNRNYKLDIDDNTEDELSILKNEIYKTTVMLKEVAENSKQDKVNLKDSLSDISHQLKTPLTSIIIMLDNILDNPNMEERTREEFIKDIKKEIININFLVDSLLKLSKLDANSIKFTKKEENIEDVINEAINKVSVLSDLKDVEIKLETDKNIKINCDLKWQAEAITNLLKNAIEHSKQGSIINIKVSQNKVYSSIEIEDNGIGIAKNDLPHIFERFYKGKNANPESVGIGLALSKAIIEKGNGSIDVESEEGVGTKFIIKYYA